MTPESFQSYFKDKIDDVDVNDNGSDGKSFENKTKNSMKNSRTTSNTWNFRRQRTINTILVPSLYVEVTFPLNNS